MKLWKSAIVGMIERPGDYQHKISCPHKNTLANQQATIVCGCQLESGNHPNWVQLAPALSRVAVSPVFAAPFVEESRAWLERKSLRSGHAESSQNGDRCHSDDCDNNATMACSRCQKARYCSRACQKTHWKKAHKSQCQERTEDPDNTASRPLLDFAADSPTRVMITPTGTIRSTRTFTVKFN